MPAVDIDGVLVQSGNNLENKQPLHGNANMSMPYGNDQCDKKIDAFKDLRNVGDIVQCATEGCTNTFQVRTTWHKYCPECRAKKDAPYAQRKRKK